MKDIKQIQEENYKIVSKYNSEDLILKIITETFSRAPLYLHHVLLALNKAFTKYIESIDITLDILTGQVWEDNSKFLFQWNLTKPTLEEQTEETQRAINELLKENNDK